eukprot:1420780-Karenia_brevis.AAC.1
MGSPKTPQLRRLVKSRHLSTSVVQQFPRSARGTVDVMTVQHVLNRSARYMSILACKYVYM